MECMEIQVNYEPIWYLTTEYWYTGSGLGKFEFMLWSSAGLLQTSPYCKNFFFQNFTGDPEITIFYFWSCLHFLTISFSTVLPTPNQPSKCHIAEGNNEQLYYFFWLESSQGHPFGSIFGDFAHFLNIKKKKRPFQCICAHHTPNCCNLFRIKRSSCVSCSTFLKVTNATYQNTFMFIVL